MRDIFHRCFKFECIEPVATLSLIDRHVRIGQVELERSGTVRSRQNM